MKAAVAKSPVRARSSAQPCGTQGRGAVDAAHLPATELCEASGAALYTAGGFLASSAQRDGPRPCTLHPLTVVARPWSHSNANAPAVRKAVVKGPRYTSASITL